MKFYIETIEQIKGETEGTYAEYATQERVVDYTLAESKYFKKLSDVAADIGKNHFYMNIRMLNSIGGVLRKDEVGQYVNDEAVE